MINFEGQANNIHFKIDKTQDRQVCFLSAAHGLYCGDSEDNQCQTFWECACCKNVNTLWQNYGLIKYRRLIF